MERLRVISKKGLALRATFREVVETHYDVAARRRCCARRGALLGRAVLRRELLGGAPGLGVLGLAQVRAGERPRAPDALRDGGSGPRGRVARPNRAELPRER